jgi:hypothetical protein
MRPFPPFDPEEILHGPHDVKVSSGPTTFPTRNDMLIGSRYDAPFLGSYDQWLDYHTGNVAFREAADKVAGVYKTLGPVFRSHLINTVVKESTLLGGRFLQQDYETGDWRVMTDAESREVATEQVLAAGSGLLKALRKEMDWLMADYRFGAFRGTVMAAAAQETLWRLRKRMFLGDAAPMDAASKGSSTPASSTSFSFLKRLSVATLPESPSVTATTRSRRRLMTATPSTVDGEDFPIGSLVWCFYEPEEAWYPGTIVGVDLENDTFSIAYVDGGTVEDGVELHRLHPYHSVTEGDRILGCFSDGFEDCFPGTVLRVTPAAYVSIEYDDGDLELLVEPTRWYIPPYRYAGPIFYI